jgi:hypothetical protein
MAEERPQESEDDKESGEGPGGAPSPGARALRRRPRIPPTEATDQEKKRYAVAVDQLGRAALEVTVDDGRVARTYAPADLISGLTERVQALLRDVGGGFHTMFYGALATNSMTLYFGDPQPEDAQAQLPLEVTISHARRVAELMGAADDDELFARALALGEPARRYTDLMHFVESENITLRWKPLDDPVTSVTSRRAAQQYARLIDEPEHDERSMTVNGTLYRVIADRGERRLGTVGIRLHSWSLRPPTRHGVQRRAIIAAYESPEVETAIKRGLISEPVEAMLIVRQPKLGLSIDPEHVELVVAEIRSGPSEESRLGSRMFGDDDLDE